MSRGAAESGGRGFLPARFCRWPLTARQQQVFAAEDGRQRLLLFAVVGKGRGQDTGPQRSVQRMGGAVFLYRSGRAGSTPPAVRYLGISDICTNTSISDRVGYAANRFHAYHSTIAGICVEGVWGKNTKRQPQDQGCPSSKKREMLRFMPENCALSGVLQTCHLLDSLHGKVMVRPIATPGHQAG